MIAQKIIFLIVLTLAVTGAQFLVRKLVGKLNHDILGTFQNLKEYLPEFNKKYKNGQEMAKAFLKESYNFELIQKKKDTVGYITILIGSFEILFFGALTILLLRYLGGSVLSIFREITIFAGGWIALKIFGGYQQWSGAVLGRAYFYTFLLGSIINIITAVVIGYAFFVLIL